MLTKSIIDYNKANMLDNYCLTAEDILNNLGSIILMVKINPNGNTLPIWANSKYTEVFGYSIKERKALGFIDDTMSFFHPEDYELVKKKIKQCLVHRDNEKSLILRIKAKNGKWIWSFFKAKAITIKNDPNYLLCNGFNLLNENQLQIIRFIQDSNRKNNIQKVNKLTTTEKDIIKKIVSGYSTREISVERNRSFETINNHKRNIFKKLQISKISELTVFALENGIHPPIEV